MRIYVSECRSRCIFSPLLLVASVLSLTMMAPSSSLVDIWSRNTHLIPYLPNPTMHAELYRPEQVSHPDAESSYYEDSDAGDSSLSLLNPAGGELGGIKFLPLSSSSAYPTDTSPAAPKRWSEIVIPKSLSRNNKHGRSTTVSQIDAVLKDDHSHSDTQSSSPLGIFDVLPVA